MLSIVPKMEGVPSLLGSRLSRLTSLGIHLSTPTENAGSILTIEYLFA
jgi:hypothetical protein